MIKELSLTLENYLSKPMKYDVNKILEGIKKQRKKLGYTQGELAQELGIQRETYTQIENGKNSMTLERFLRICEVLKITPIELIYTEGLKDNLNTVYEDFIKTVTNLLKESNINADTKK